jgi:hypothetical protein
MNGAFLNAAENFENYKTMMLGEEVFHKVKPHPDSPERERLFDILATAIHDAVCIYSPKNNEEEINLLCEKFYNETIYKGTAKRYIGDESFSTEIVRKKKEPKKEAKSEPVKKEAKQPVTNSEFTDLPQL